MIEYGKLAWLKVRKAKSKKKQVEVKDRFDAIWTQNEFLYHWDGMTVH
jgi:hypothetical protein